MSSETEQLLVEGRSNTGCPDSTGYVQFIPFNVDIPLPPTILVPPKMLGMAMGMEQALALCLMSVHQQQMDRKEESAGRSANRFGHRTRHPQPLLEEHICTRANNSATLSYVIRLMGCLNRVINHFVIKPLCAWQQIDGKRKH